MPLPHLRGLMLTVITLLAYYLVVRGSLIGYILSVAASVLWIFEGVEIASTSLIITQVCFMAINLHKLGGMLWHRILSTK